MNEICQQIDQQIKLILEQNVKMDNVEYLYKLVDVKKDIKNIEYWEEKISMMRNREYGNYNNYGRYNARGYDTRYRGEESALNSAYNEYNEYSYGRDSYGADETTIKSLERMLGSLEDFMRMLKQSAKSEQEVMMIKESARRIAEM